MSKLSKRNRTRSSQGEARPFEGMRQVNPHAAGVDIGAHEIMACVPDGDDHQIVRPFGTSTAALDALVAASSDLDRAVEEEGISLLIPLWTEGVPVFGAQTAARWEAYAAWMVERGLIPADLDVAAAYNANLLPPPPATPSA